MKLYGLKTCDTCRKARAALPGAQFVDVRTDGMPAEVLQAALATFGAALVNTRSATWRGLDDAARALPPEQLIAAHPAVMKRPLIDDDGALWLGWDRAVQAALSGKP